MKFILMTIRLFLVLFLLAPSLRLNAMEENIEESSSIKMGIELELQGIRYINSPITLVDHLKLFVSNNNKSDVSNWYLEVDGSGNLEFVSRPFEIHKEKEELYKTLQEMHSLMFNIITESQSCYDEENKGAYSFLTVKKNTEWKALGKWILQAPEENILDEEKEKLENQETIDIQLKDVTCRVRPQATFEFPLLLVPQFSSYMSTGHSKLDKLIKSIKISDEATEPQHVNGLLYLARLYTNLLEDEAKYEELGPKEKLPLMSRKSFNSMYKSLGDEQDKFKDRVPLFFLQENLNKNLFAISYPIYFDGDDLGKKDFKGGIEEINHKMWLDSMVDPSEAFNKRKIYKDAWKNLAVKSTTTASKIIMKQIKDGLFDRSTDFVSPPPFLPNTYSMGKYENEDKTAIIEMRGYPRTYGANMNMGKMVLEWLGREHNNALIGWNLSEIVDKKQYDLCCEEISSSMEESYWYKDEEFSVVSMNLFKKHTSTKLDDLVKKSSSSSFEEIVKGFPHMLQDFYKNMDNALKDPIMKVYKQKKEWGSSFLLKDFKNDY